MRLMAHQGTIRWSVSRWSALVLMTTALCSCVGAPIAQQIVQSILLHGADKATAAALDANEEKQKLAAQNMPLKNTTPDKYDIAFINAGFEEVKPQIEPCRHKRHWTKKDLSNSCKKLN
jgi:hypothetical protein